MTADQTPFLRLVLGDTHPTPQTPPPAPTAAPGGLPEGRSSYATSALFREAEKVRHAFEGERNHTLNTATFSLAQLVAAGHLAEDEVVAELTQAARAAGLHPKEIAATIRSGMRGGKQHPRQVPELAEGAIDVHEVAAGELTHTEQASVVDRFWESRPVLRHIRTFAYSRMTAPWAVLGGCLLRAVGAIAPHIVTPPIIGGVGSLNILLSLVGPSGTGKGASESAAGDALTWPMLHTAPLGSGEGITHAYAKPRPRKKGDDHDPNPDPLIWEHKSVLFTSPEIDQLAAIKDRRGSTLMAQLRSAYSGERLGMQYADVTRRIILPAHHYRFGLSVGVQPDRAGWLLEDADGGTPQRFIWLPVTDPNITADPPSEPEVYRWTAPLAVLEHVPGARRDTHGRIILPIPEHVRATIRQAHASRARGEGEALDGHALYTRLKVSVALALLDERLVVNDEDWELAGVVMDVSDMTRTRIQARLSAQLEAASKARAQREAVQQEVVEETRADSAAQRVARGLSKRLSRAGTMTRAEARKTLASRDRNWFDDALQRLVEAGQIVVEDSEHGEVLQWVES